MNPRESSAIHCHEDPDLFREAVSFTVIRTGFSARLIEISSTSTMPHGCWALNRRMQKWWTWSDKSSQFAHTVPQATISLRVDTPSGRRLPPGEDIASTAA